MGEVTPLPDWVPVIEYKQCEKQITFIIPLVLLPTARTVLLKRYVEDIGERDQYKVNWTDVGHDRKPVSLPRNFDVRKIEPNLDWRLFQFRVGTALNSRRLITITVFCTTGTVLVQGNACKVWQRKEFENITSVIRLVYTWLQALHHPVKTPSIGSSPPPPPAIDLPFPVPADFRSGRELAILSPDMADTQGCGSGSDFEEQSDGEADAIPEPTPYPFPDQQDATTGTDASPCVDAVPETDTSLILAVRGHATSPPPSTYTPLLLHPKP
jgi:hypothetical protein